MRLLISLNAAILRSGPTSWSISRALQALSGSRSTTSSGDTGYVCLSCALSNEEIRHENQSGKGHRNAHYLENGAVDCEVLFEGEGNSSRIPPCRMIPPRQASASGGVTERQMGRNRPVHRHAGIIAAAKDAKKREIEVWRTEQKHCRSRSNGTVAPGTLAPTHGSPLSGSNGCKIGYDTNRPSWGDADNQQVKLSMPELEELRQQWRRHRSIAMTRFISVSGDEARAE